ncbi:hypothetical protein CPC08DRAFT_714242 [Agrocybe pediades]|nr:hypothetical protein CPC08DRAFT_714242 [Agrocybe pediades]
MDIVDESGRRLNINLTLGPLVIGILLNAFIYGICVLQFSTYWESTSKDRPIIKLLVGWTFLLDTFHTSALLYMLWIYVVVHFNDPDFLNSTLWPFSLTPIVTTLTSLPIQIFLSWRIKEFASSMRVFVGLIVLSVTQATLGFLCSIQALEISSISLFPPLIPVVDAWQVLSIMADGSITVFLSWYLLQSRTGQKRSDNVIQRIIRSSIETAALGAFFCMMDLVTFTTLQNTNFHVIFAFPMGRIYTNTLLMTLNSRQVLRAELERPIIPDIVLDSVHNPAHFQPPASALVVTDRNNSISVAMNIYRDGNTARSEDFNSTYPDNTDALRSKEIAGENMA